MVMNDSCVTTLPDGRDLGWLEIGDPAGAPVFAFHGTPGSRLQHAVDDTRLRAIGVRVISPDRPGYGLSTFQPARRLIDWPRDVAHLADHLGIERFAVMGISGGGPHSAVCAALLGDRVTAAAIVSGVGSLADPRATEGMMRSNELLTALTRRAPGVMRVIIGLQVEALRRWPERGFAFLANRLPPPDVAVISRPEVRALLTRDAVRSSRTAGRAAAQDFALFAGDWGFDLGAIAIPVHIWQGDLDRNVPAHHARLMHEAIPGSVLHELAGQGHFLAFDYFEDIVSTLVTPTLA
jgi:pimeloyl-ACP methyl ester carboxylesterase